MLHEPEPFGLVARDPGGKARVGLGELRALGARERPGHERSGLGLEIGVGQGGFDEALRDVQPDAGRQRGVAQRIEIAQQRGGGLDRRAGLA